MKKLYVKWIDSGYSIRSDIWQTQDEVIALLQEPKSVETIGFLVEEDDEWIILAQSVGLDLIRGGYIIYKKNIIEREELQCLKQ